MTVDTPVLHHKKKPLLDYCEANSCQFMVRTETPSNGYYGFEDVHAFLAYMETVPENQRTFYEYMTETTPRRFYFDIEYIDADGNEDVEPFNKCLEKIEEYFKEYFDIAQPEFEIATASGCPNSNLVEYKNSFHVLLKNYFLPNHKTMRNVVDHMKGYFSECKEIDFAPYGGTQSFRILGCTKRPKKAGDLLRFKRPYAGSSQECLDHLVTFLRGEEELSFYTFFAKTDNRIASLPRSRGHKRKRASRDDSGCHSENEDDDTGEFVECEGRHYRFNFFKAESLLALLDPSYYNDYEKWIRIGMALKQYGPECFILFKEFSQQSHKYDAKECEEKWRSFPDDAQVSCQTLIYEARQCNPEAVDDIFAHIKTPVQSKYMKAVFGVERLQQILQYVDRREDAERITIQFLHATVVFVLNGCNAYYMVKMGPNRFQKINVDKYEKSMGSHLCCQFKNSVEECVDNMLNSSTDKVENPHVDVKKLHQRIQDRISHDQMVFNPGLPFDDNAYTINRFMGYRLTRFDFKMGSMGAKAELIYRHIDEVLLDRESNASRAFFFGWLNRLLNNPGPLTRICVVLYSLPGCGKNIFTHFLRRVIGDEYVYETTEDRLFQKFNSQMENQILVIGNELANRGMTKRNADKLKDLITCESLEVESKGMNSEVVPNYANFILTTNNIDALKVERGDRRFYILELSSRHCRDADYFNALSAAIEDDEAVREFLTWLHTKYDKEVWNPSMLPMTAVKQEMIISNAPDVVQFMVDSRSIFEDEWVGSTQVAYDIFFTKYKAWMLESGTNKDRRLKRRQVENDLKTYFGATLTSNINGYKNNLHIDFKSLNSIEQHMKKHFGYTFKWE